MKRLALSLFALALSCCAVNAQGVPGLGMGVQNNPAGIQSNLTSSSAPTVNNDSTQGYQVGSIWQNSATGQVWVARSVSAGAAVWDLLGSSDFPTYIAGNWYVPYTLNMRIAGAPTAPGAGSIRLFPFTLKQRTTLQALGVRVQTVSAGGNVQAAIYASNTATGRPTGSALASTSSMSTTSTGSVSGSISLQLEAGQYWLASNCDNGTAAFASWDIAAPGYSMLIGSTTQTNNLQSTQTMVGVSTPQTFGTWPSLTSATFTEVNGFNIPIVQFQVLSTP